MSRRLKTMKEKTRSCYVGGEETHNLRVKLVTEVHGLTELVRLPRSISEGAGKKSMRYDAVAEQRKGVESSARAGN